MDGGRASRAILPAYALSGFASLAYQVVWLRVLTDRFGSTNLTFLLVISCFIAGLGLGALASARVTATLARLTGQRDALRLYGIVELLVCATMLATPMMQSTAPNWTGTAKRRSGNAAWSQLPSQMPERNAASMTVKL